MQERYEPAAVERAARAFWDEQRVFEAREDAASEGNKFYCLSMFPYPSGRLHMGHVRNYTIGDVLTRFHKMQGKAVLQPMGWDAFGLPAENAAMKNGVPPAKWTRDNIAYMKGQMKSLGLAFDWSREIATCDPSYYKLEPVVVPAHAREGHRVSQDRRRELGSGRPDRARQRAGDRRASGWRTGALVEKREIPMYYLAITKYAEELLGDLEKLPDWPERVKTMQANWIGKSEGCEISFPYAPDTKALMGADGTLKVFTTRADTLFGVTYMAVAAEHPIALAAGAKNPALQAFIDECRRGSTMEADIATQEKKGMRTGFSVLHPFTGEMVEVWVANYVLMAYGEGAVMGVPGHDARDYEFALKNSLPIVQVMKSKTGAYENLDPPWQDAFTEYGITMNSGEFDGLEFQAAIDAIAARAREERPGPQAHAMASARLGHFAPALLGLPGAHDPLREVRRSAGARRGPAGGAARGAGARWFRQSAQQDARRSMSASVRSAAPTRVARRTPWTPSSIRRGTSCVSPARMRTPWWTRAPTTGCRWTSTSAASNTPSCTCCTRVSGPR